MRVDEIVGYIGIILLLLAYYLVSTKKLDYNSFLYQALNLLGAAGLVINTVVTKSWPSVILNAIWAIIAFVSLFNISLFKKSSLRRIKKEIKK